MYYKMNFEKDTKPAFDESIAVNNAIQKLIRDRNTISVSDTKSFLDIIDIKPRDMDLFMVDDIVENNNDITDLSDIKEVEIERRQSDDKQSTKRTKKLFKPKSKITTESGLVTSEQLPNIKEYYFKPNKDIQMLNCKECGKETRNGGHMREHILDNHFGHIKTICPLCKKWCKSGSNIRLHMSKCKSSTNADV